MSTEMEIRRLRRRIAKARRRIKNGKLERKEKLGSVNETEVEDRLSKRLAELLAAA